MSGAINDYLIYPILDIVRDEIRRNNNRPLRLNSVTPTQNTAAGDDPFKGTPSVNLVRNHPLDTERVTGADLIYESGYRVMIDIRFGTKNVDPLHPDYEYISKWRLSEVLVTPLDNLRNPLGTFIIRLNYDSKGALTGTKVVRI